VILKQYLTYLLSEGRFEEIKQYITEDFYDTFGITKKSDKEEKKPEQKVQKDVKSLSWEEIKTLGKELGLNPNQKKEKLIVQIEEALNARKEKD
jgi:phage terminase small subunit